MDGIEITLFILRFAVIVIDIILFTVMLRKTLKIELDITKKYFMGVTIFFLVHAICRTFYLLDSVYNGEILILGDIGTLLGLLSVEIIVADIESTIYKKSKHIITLYGVVGLSIMTVGVFVKVSFFGLSLMRVAQYMTIPILATFILLIYFNVARKSTGKVRSNAYLMTVGILVFCIGEMANTPTAAAIPGIGPAIPFLAPIAMIIGLIIMYVSVSNYFKTE